MGMTCTICNNPRRVEIDRELVQGKSISAIGREFGVSLESLSGHRDSHLSRQLVQAYDKKQFTESMDLLTRIEDILSKAKNIFDRNYAIKRDGLALKALSEQRATIELLAKIAAFLHESRAMELQRQEGSYEFRRKQEEQERVKQALERLNDAEQDLWVALIEKIEGVRDDDIIPYYETKWPTKFRPALYDEPVRDEPIPESEPIKRTRYPLSVQPIEPTPLEPYRKDHSKRLI